jgi:hypothetical protein
MRAITTLAQLNALDTDVVVEGYRAALHNTPDHTRREQAYWHGYLNGEVDAGRMPISKEQAELARAVVAASRAH